MRVAHEEGLNTSCTMMMGHIETVPERMAHIGALRDMQDYAKAVGSGRWAVGSEEEEVIRKVRALHPGVFAKSDLPTADRRLPTGHYEAFIHWPFQRENVPLGRAKEYDPGGSRRL